jgi:cobalt-zinc-cadmium efflux system membrane fusion protein
MPEAPPRQTAADNSPGAAAGRPRGGGAREEPALPRRGFGRSTGRGWQETIVTLSDDERRAIDLQTVRATPRPLRSRHQAMGMLFVPQTRKAIVSYPLPARIADVHVRIGDWVKAGQAVVTLQCEEVGSARAAYQTARSTADLARKSFDREKRLFDRGVGAQKAYLSAEAELAFATTNLQAAEKRLSVLGLAEADVKGQLPIDAAITLFAPIGGKVLDHKAVLGGMVDPATDILTIMDPTVLWVDGAVYERDIARIKPGQEVALAVPAYPGESFAGSVSFIGDVVDAQTRTITVRSEVRNPGNRLKPGMFADVTFFLDDRRPVLALPETAILENGDEQLVFLKVGNTYVPQVVEVGVREQGYCEIVRGLQPGEEVVTSGNFQLKSKLSDQVLKGAHVH